MTMPGRKSDADGFDARSKMRGTEACFSFHRWADDLILREFQTFLPHTSGMPVMADGKTETVGLVFGPWK